MIESLEIDLGGWLTEALEEQKAAQLVAQIATVTFESAFARWVDAHGHEDFATCLHAVTTSLRDAVTT